MRNSYNVKVVLEAFSRGYRIDKKGNLIRKDKFIMSAENIGSKGYKKFTIRINGKQSTCFCHLLCAYQRYGRNAFEERICVRHKDNNKLNNKPSNILIGTWHDNSMDTPMEIHMRHAPMLKEIAKKRRLLSSTQAIKLRLDSSVGRTYQELTKKYGIAKSTVSYIVNRKTYKEI